MRKGCVAGRLSTTLDACLERLPDLYRTVIYLRYWMDCSVDEIAEQLEAPSGTIKSYLLFRARRRLHGLLEAEGIDYA